GANFTSNGSSLSFGTSNSYPAGITNTAMTINYNGNIGVGTTSPETKLLINDQTAVSSFTGINNAGLRIHSYDNPLNNYALIGFSGFGSYLNRNLAQIGANFTNNGSSLYFGTSNSYGSGITNTAMIINYFGNVGIGRTTSPAF